MKRSFEAEVYRDASTWKRFILRLQAMLAKRRHDLPLLKPEQVRRVLLMRYDRIGDVVITTPFIESLQRLVPHAEIDVLASPANRSLLECDPRIGHVYCWDRSLLKRIVTVLSIRRRKYDVIYQLILARASTPALLAAFLAGQHGRTVGRGIRYHRFLLNHMAVTLDSSVHFCEQTYALLPYGIECTPPSRIPDYSLYVPEDIRRQVRETVAREELPDGGFVVLNISSAERKRELTDAQNEKLSRLLSQHGYRVVVIGGPSVADRAEGIAQRAGVTSLRLPSVLHVIAFLSHARLTITPDTGIVHFASAVKCPVIAMFAPDGNPSGWSPRGVPFDIIMTPVGTSFQELDVERVVRVVVENYP